MRFGLSEWLNIAVSLAFPTSIVFQALMQSESDNPVFMEPRLPKQQLVGSLGINDMEDGGR